MEPILYGISQHAQSYHLIQVTLAWLCMYSTACTMQYINNTPISVFTTKYTKRYENSSIGKAWVSNITIDWQFAMRVKANYVLQEPTAADHGDVLYTIGELHSLVRNVYW